MRTKTLTAELRLSRSDSELRELLHFYATQPQEYSGSYPCASSMLPPPSWARSRKPNSREAVVKRMIALMDEAKAKGADLIVYPELALTTFFPRWYMEDQAEVDTWFEREMPNAATKPLFERAAHHQIAMNFGYAELTPGRASFQHLHPHRQVRAKLSESTARFICRVIRSSIRSAPSSIWRSATSSPAISASTSGARSAASSAWRSATTGAGRRPIA